MTMSDTNELFHKPFFIAPKQDIFEKRAQRYQSLIDQEGSQWKSYLELLRQICVMQDWILKALPPVSDLKVSMDGRTILQANHRLPVAFQGVLSLLCQELRPKLPAHLQILVQDLEALSSEEKAQLASTLSVPHSFQDLLIQAALEVIWTSAAISLHESDVPSVENREACPCCGHDFVASMVLLESELFNLRYLHCSRCNGRWNALRAKCVFCGSQEKMALEKIDNAEQDVYLGARAEVCLSCHRYQKMFLQAEQPYSDPVADDLASLALDILLAEQDYQRGGFNPYLMMD